MRSKARKCAQTVLKRGAGEVDEADRPAVSDWSIEMWGIRALVLELRGHQLGTLGFIVLM